MRESDVERIQKFLLGMVDSPRSKVRIRRTTGRFLKVVVVLAIISSVAGFIANGTDFFTRKIPSAASWAFGSVVYSKNFVPLLSERVVAEQLGLGDVCTDRTILADFDQDGKKTDLVIAVNRTVDGVCDGYGPSTMYAVFKEIDGTGFWPNYSLLRLIRVSDFGSFSLGSGLPVSFEVYDKFLVATSFGTDFPGHIVFGYANGILHQFGFFSPLGAHRESPQGAPVLLVGNYLFLPAEEGMMSFSITPTGDFVSRPMTAKDIVARNNSAIVIEDEENFSNETVETIAFVNNSSTDEDNLGQGYKLGNVENDHCSNIVFANGEFLDFERVDGETTCSASIEVLIGSVFVSNVPCNYVGFFTTTHFPWGWQPDPASDSHAILCPEDGESDGFSYMITVQIVDKL